MVLFYLSILTLLVLILLVIIIPQIIRSLLGAPPFVRTHRRAISAIVTALDLQAGDALYDLGCGNGRILKAAISSQPAARGVGIEYNWYPALLARINVRKLPITIHHESFFATDLSSATHIYCYLLPVTLKKLESYIMRSCKPGTRIVTCDFSFPTLVPIQEITLSNAPKGPGKKLAIYSL